MGAEGGRTIGGGIKHQTTLRDAIPLADFFASADLGHAYMFASIDHATDVPAGPKHSQGSPTRNRCSTVPAVDDARTSILPRGGNSEERRAISKKKT
jgi:hypothetical protein